MPENFSEGLGDTWLMYPFALSSELVLCSCRSVVILSLAVRMSPFRLKPLIAVQLEHNSDIWSPF